VITAVQELLRQHGLDAEIADGLTAQIGASMLLRGLGIMPAIDAVDAYKRILDVGPWPDADDRRAARSG